jgi:hypothetical protein
MSNARDITAKIRPPRAVFLNHPLGNAVGRPSEPDQQRAVLRTALGLLESATEPGVIVDLAFRWPDDTCVLKLNEQYEREAGIVLRQRSEGEYDVDPSTGECRH